MSKNRLFSAVSHDLPLITNPTEGFEFTEQLLNVQQLGGLGQCDCCFLHLNHDECC